MPLAKSSDVEKYRMTFSELYVRSKCWLCPSRGLAFGVKEGRYEVAETGEVSFCVFSSLHVCLIGGVGRVWEWGRSSLSLRGSSYAILPHFLFSDGGCSLWLPYNSDAVHFYWDLILLSFPWCLNVHVASYV
ncbi:hypothetical protein V6N13_124012 [Hibiscus sabdariffa]